MRLHILKARPNRNGYLVTMLWIPAGVGLFVAAMQLLAYQQSGSVRRDSLCLLLVRMLSLSLAAFCACSRDPSTDRQPPQPVVCAAAGSLGHPVGRGIQAPPARLSARMGYGVFAPWHCACASSPACRHEASPHCSEQCQSTVLRWTHIQRQRSPARPPSLSLSPSPSLLQVNYEAPQTDRRDFVQNPATYKRLNKKSSREEFYPDPLLRVAWLIASSVIIRFDVPCPTLYR